ncbi:MAG: hypothetical protein U9Q15_05655 [Patescibacteria group bacterium]|nr:hypothetical protein [Patescibacteria group bacterium]
MVDASTDMTYRFGSNTQDYTVELEDSLSSIDDSTDNILVPCAGLINTGTTVQTGNIVTADGTVTECNAEQFYNLVETGATYQYGFSQFVGDTDIEKFARALLIKGTNIETAPYPGIDIEILIAPYVDALLTSNIDFVQIEAEVVGETGTGEVVEETGTGEVVEETGTGEVVEETGAGEVVEETGTGEVVEETGTGEVVEEVIIEETTDYSDALKELSINTLTTE